ncbi:hypothetical protein TGAM01_v202345 [Trichoderma gamsii]|uniref:Uncharacterized protein n=1 Tax=Trichoderma gamsii TaxID=398673 RepID=A0A2P4ZW53_9HYPO|nr:hypothetical protein TGAM01_v202345 [Trichoderma gamsii]PON28498.1 hypothetical protein TGAM01_v202345 [Trichoderma gamsii]
MDHDGSRLVIPNDCIMECKNSMHARFLSMRALANTNDFTIHFKDADTSKSTRDHLFQIASIFSASNTKRPATDHRRIDLQSLYGGIGGHVFDASTTLAGGNNDGDQALPKDTSAPPPIDYEPTRESKPLRKRLIEHLLDMENRLRNDMKVMTESSEKRLRNGMKDMIESSENRLRANVKNMIESTENRLRSHVKDVVEASESRLKEELNDMLDSRADDIDRRIDGSVDDLRTECIGTIESEFGYLKYGIEEVTNGLDEAEEKMKGVLSLLDEAGDGIERRVGRYLNSIRLQVTVEDE